MFWEEVLESVKILLQIYGYMLGGGVVVGVVLVVAGLILAGIQKSLVWLRIPALLTRIQASVTAFLGGMAQLLSSLARQGWKSITSAAPAVLGILGLGLGPWLFVCLVVLDIVKNRAAWAVGSTVISLPLCLIGWPVFSRLVGEKVEWADLPKIVGIAVLWIAPTLASFPIIFLSD